MSTGVVYESLTRWPDPAPVAVAGELVMPIAMAVENHLSVEPPAHTIAIYPSISGSVAGARPSAHAA